jgi:hypothetical protein
MTASQLPLSFDPKPPRRRPPFDGKYDVSKDHKRMAHQLDTVREFMADGVWRTVAEIVQALTTHEMAQGTCLRCKTTDRAQPCLLAHATETGISARLRDLRKPKFGGYVVESKRRYDGGLWEYRLVVPISVPKTPFAGRVQTVDSTSERGAGSVYLKTDDSGTSGGCPTAYEQRSRLPEESHENRS